MPCPICNRERDAKYHPFCSKKCADIDLGRWFNGAYTAPAQEAEDLSDAQAEVEKSNSRLH